MKNFDVDRFRRNKRIFENYCRLRSQSAYDLNPEKASMAFEVIPVLLSLNEPELPGYVSGGEKGCGIYRIGSSEKMKRVVQTYFPEIQSRKISYQSYLIKRPAIESLFIMGSIGTVAQMNKSDFDFWVCVDNSRISKSDANKLFLKTERINRWCKKHADMEVHFFIMDIEQIRKNDFGKLDEESAGSSQKKFLKEEFYRTMLLVSGKIPFWWVVPLGSSEKEYEKLWNWWTQQDLYDSDDFVDLGFLDNVPREEFLGATLWQLSKGIKDPFKALIKMTLMEWYLSDNFQGPLLCDVLKERVLKGSMTLRNLDPYLLMVETVLDYYGRLERWNHVDLLRRAFYIKANPKINRMRLKTGIRDYQVIVFRELMANWKWSLSMVEDLNQMENWSYARHLRLADKINKFFISTYRRLKKTLDEKEQQVIDEEDLNMIGRQLFVLFNKHKNKLQMTPFLTKKRTILEKCIFKYDHGKSGKTRWRLYDVSSYPFEKQDKKLEIFASHRAARAAAWLIFNGLYDFHRTQIDMPPNPSGLNVNDLIDLLKHLQGTFLPAVHQIKMGANFQNDAMYDRIMVIPDMEENIESMYPVSMDLILNNTWGELFTETYPFQEGLLIIKKYVLKLNTPSIDEVRGKVKIHVHKSLMGKNVKKMIFEPIMHSL